jgi:hypothetical protein
MWFEFMLSWAIKWCIIKVVANTIQVYEFIHLCCSFEFSKGFATCVQGDIGDEIVGIKIGATCIIHWHYRT